MVHVRVCNVRVIVIIVIIAIAISVSDPAKVWEVLFEPVDNGGNCAVSGGGYLYSSPRTQWTPLCEHVRVRFHMYTM
jgi:hypothetical protein